MASGSVAFDLPDELVRLGFCERLPDQLRDQVSLGIEWQRHWFDPLTRPVPSLSKLGSRLIYEAADVHWQRPWISPPRVIRVGLLSTFGDAVGAARPTGEAGPLVKSLEPTDRIELST